MTLDDFEQTFKVTDGSICTVNYLILRIFHCSESKNWNRWREDCEHGVKREKK